MIDINTDINQHQKNTVRDTTPVENVTVNMQKKSNLFKGQEKGFFVKSMLGFIIVYFILGLHLADFLVSFIKMITPYTNIIIYYIDIIIYFLMIIVLPILLGIFSANKRRIRYIKSHNKGTNKAIRIFNITLRGTIILMFLTICIGGFIAIEGEKLWEMEVARSLCRNIGFIIALMGPILVWGFLRRCRNCKMLFMLKRTETKQSSSENISVKVEVERRDLDGNVVGTQDQWIPGTRIWYRKKFRCKACGQVHYSLFSQDYANT